MSVNSHACLLRRIEEILHLSEVHRTVVSEDGSLLHCISGCHLIEVLGHSLVLIGLAKEVAHSNTCSQLEVRRLRTVHIVLKSIILVKVVVCQSILET